MEIASLLIHFELCGSTDGSTGLLLKVSRGKYDSKYFGLVLLQEIESLFEGYEGNKRETQYDWRQYSLYWIYWRRSEVFCQYLHIVNKYIVLCLVLPVPEGKTNFSETNRYVLNLVAIIDLLFLKIILYYHMGPVRSQDPKVCMGAYGRLSVI